MVFLLEHNGYEEVLAGVFVKEHRNHLGGIAIADVIDLRGRDVKAWRAVPDPLPVMHLFLRIAVAAERHCD